MIRARDVYDVLGLPTGLRLHLARTVAVVRMMLEDDSPGGLRADAQCAMALHDVGNAVKMSDDPETASRMLQEPEVTLPRWRLYSSFARARYGSDDHAATTAMLTELGVKQHLIELVARKSSKNLHSILETDSTLEMVVLYADMRVGPEGVVSIAERHREATARLAGTERQGLGGTLTVDDLRALEDEVCRRLACDPAAVTDARAGEILDDCLNMDMTHAFD